MQKFHITITENETGETKVDQDTDCIIGSIDDVGGGTQSFSYVDCYGVALIATVIGAAVEIERDIHRMSPDDQRIVRKLIKQETKQ